MTEAGTQHCHLKQKKKTKQNNQPKSQTQTHRETKTKKQTKPPNEQNQPTKKNHHNPHKIKQTKHHKPSVLSQRSGQGENHRYQWLGMYVTASEMNITSSK